MLIIDQQIRDGSNDEHGPEDTQMFSNVDIYVCTSIFIIFGYGFQIQFLYLIRYIGKDKVIIVPTFFNMINIDVY